MTPSLETLKRRAKALKAAVANADSEALARAKAYGSDSGPFSHAQALHVIAREAGFESWPKLKFAYQTQAMTLAEQAERLKNALYLGKQWEVQALLAKAPDLGRANFGLQCALYDVEGVRDTLSTEPSSATKMVGARRPILHLAFSRHFQGAGHTSDMLEVARLLIERGADVNDAYPAAPDSSDMLSALYGAIGHGGNMALGKFLLEQGANPNDNESLYHATELGHRDGLKLLLAHGADPKGTNALLRAMDFDDLEAVEMLLAAGADPNDQSGQYWNDETPIIPALHQAARRGCSVDIVRALLAQGADTEALFSGHSAYALACVYGNAGMAQALKEAGARTDLTPVERHLADAADGTAGPRDWIDMAKITGELRYLLTRLVSRSGTLGHMQRLVAIGFDANACDEQNMPPFHLAGWEGLPAKLEWLLSLMPDMAHLNRYGGNLLSTIVHGSENCPERDGRDHLACAELALTLGVALPKPMIAAAADPAMAAFLTEWAARYPGQVVEDDVY